MLRMEWCAMLIMALLVAPGWADDNVVTIQTTDCCVPACSRAPGLIVFADYLNWKIRSDSLACINRETTIGTTVTTETEYVSLPQQSGVRAGLGYRFDNQWDVAWISVYYSTTGENTANSASGAYLSVPLIGSDYDEVRVRTNLRYNVNDLEIGRWLRMTDHMDLRAFGSFRYATTESHSDLDLLGAYIGDSTADNLNKMDAFGIRLGCEGRWRIGNGNLSLFGRGAGSALAGRFENTGTTIQQSRTLAPTYTLIYLHNDTHAVGVLEAAAGVAYQYGNWELSGGYELATWFNQAVPVTHVAQNNNESFSYEDLLIDGLFARLAYRY